MKRIAFIMILLTIIQPNLFAQEVKVITGATLIDGVGGVPLKDAVIVIEGPRIKQVGPKEKIEIPKNAVVIDARDKFVTPGLADMHNHLRDGLLSRRPQALGNARRLLAFGVTTVFFPDANLRLLATLKQEAGPNNSAYPDIFGAGPMVTVKGGSLSGELRAPNTADEARAVAKDMKAASVDAIELGYDDHTCAMKARQPLLKDDVVVALITDAHLQGLKVFVHAPILEQAKVVLRAGADGLMHGIIDKPVDDEFIALMKKNRACYVSTLALFEAVGDVAGWVKREAAYDSRMTYPSSVIEAFTSKAGREQFESFLTNAAFTKTHLPTLRANLKMVNDAGILIVAGTDTGLSGVFPGVASHLELILHAEAGLRTADIIKAATINAARMIGREKDLGTIEEGKVADLLILDANPLDDIRNIKQIHRVIKGGTMFEPAELLKR